MSEANALFPCLIIKFPPIVPIFRTEVLATFCANILDLKFARIIGCGWYLFKMSSNTLAVEIGFTVEGHIFHDSNSILDGYRSTNLQFWRSFAQTQTSDTLDINQHITCPLLNIVVNYFMDYFWIGKMFSPIKISYQILWYFLPPIYSWCPLVIGLKVQ